MQTKGYSKKVSDVYVIPLPYSVKPMPPLILHNPVSVIMYLYALAQSNPVQRRHRGVICESKTESMGVRVEDPDSANALWQQGFFGKGSLSRSEPSWFGRTSRRLGLDGGELTLEEVTEMRREKRRQFKRDRELQQQQELIAKKLREGIKVEPLAPIAAADNVPEKVEIRKEDLDLVRGDTIERLEFLQLTPNEAIFLALGLGVLEVPDTSVKTLLEKMLPTEESWRQYAVYHYYRSLGWCVRDGVKFGADLLIYRKGPPFHHAEIAAMVMHPDQQRPWWWLHANMRVLGGAKKTLTLVYVEYNGRTKKSIETTNEFRKELEKYTVKPVTFSRFAPSKNRD